MHAVYLRKTYKHGNKILESSKYILLRFKESCSQQNYKYVIPGQSLAEQSINLEHKIKSKLVWFATTDYLAIPL
jgi:hypothetical protein